MKTYFFETYGCEMNVAESASVEQLFISRGWEKADNPQIADVVVINTCSIRKTAEDRINGRLGWYAGLKKVRECKPDAKTRNLEIAADFVKNGPKPLTLIFMGCMAERLLNSIQKDYPFIDYVVGTFAKHHFGEITDAIEEGKKAFTPDDTDQYKFAPTSYEQGNFETFVPIMHGCNNFCTYCIVPYVRGREISRSPEEILKELDVLKGYGVKDITLLGQNVNSYNGKDAQGNSVNFASLLQLIADHLKETKSTIGWVRFMSSHPKDFTDDVIDVIAREEVLCKHIHLPVQNGSSSVLKAMNRRYTREHYLELVKKIKERIPDASLTTDIMMGFPGETEADVEDTLSLMKEVKYETAMMYYYNPREGTPAAKLEQIPEEIRKERLQRVIDLQLLHTDEQMKKQVGKTEKVLVESVSRDNPEELLGKTERNEKVSFKADKSMIGKFVKIQIESLNGHTFKGKII
ncbi:MAG: tRNA (N6-isopentenyl adenosine(37)-C2)-methylthiotransferase MiaB [Treponema sp.]|nr:tRNA (N6-isopentenyl adenosine(37)-C2)-methylthiotransferase MiaB [Treponema sp.]